MILPSPVLDAVLEEFALPRLETRLPREFLFAQRLRFPQQYGIACADVSECCRRAEAAGAGPFVRAFIPSPGWREHGQRARGVRLEFALGYAGGQQLEFLGPGEGTDFYASALEGRDAVLHHAGIYQRGMPKLASTLTGAGYAEVVRGGLRLGSALCFDFRYFDTRPQLGFYLELLDFHWLGGRELRLEPVVRGLARLRNGLRS